MPKKSSRRGQSHKSIRRQSSVNKTTKSRLAAKAPKLVTSEVARPALPGAFRIAARTLQLLWRHKLLFGALAAIYGLLVIILVQGLSSTLDVSHIKSILDQFFSGRFASLDSGATIFVVLLGSVGNTGTNGSYQLFITIILSLAIIWSLRNIRAGSKVTIKAAFYKGMFPLIPFILSLLIIALQLIPIAIGSTIYSVVSTSVAAGVWEKIFWGGVYAGLALWSGYMLSSSIFAAYIVTLPDMTPLGALRSAQKLVQGRRWTVIRKLLFLPIALLLSAAAIMLPIIANGNIKPNGKVWVK